MGGINVVGPRSKIEGKPTVDDNLVGTASGEDIYGYGGNDVIEGRGGADRIYGGDNFDIASYASSGAVQIDLSQTVQHGGEELYSIEGVIGSGFVDFLAGNGENNSFEGGGGGDTINGAGGFDTAIYRNSFAPVQVNLNQVVQSGGEAAGDQLYSIENVVGSVYADTLTGNGEDNRLEGGAGLDTIKGEGGKDTLLGGFDGKADIVDGGTGVDTVDYSAGPHSMTITLGSGAVEGSAVLDAFTMVSHGITLSRPAVLEDRLSNIENVIGTAAADIITGNGENNRLEGGGGSDVINGGQGDDTLDGGSGVHDELNGAGGFDTVTYENSYNGVQVDLRRNAVQHGGDAEGDELFFIENAIGSQQRDTITGTTTENRLEGGGGEDTILGLAGNDVIVGGLGRDWLDGGRDADTFVYTNVNDSVLVRSTDVLENSGDTILNFESGIDKIDLSRIDANGTLNGEGQFYVMPGFTGSAGQLTIQGGDIRGDVNGDGVVDFLLHVQGAFAVSDIIM